MRKIILNVSFYALFIIVLLNVVSWYQLKNMEPYPTFKTECRTFTDWDSSTAQFVTTIKECHKAS